MENEAVKSLINDAIIKLKQAKVEASKDYIMSAIEDINNASDILLIDNGQEEACIIDSENWIEKLKFMNQNTSYTIDTDNRAVKVTTNVRAAIFSFKIDESPLNTDVEIEGYLQGGRNPEILSGTTRFPLLTDKDGYFKVRLYCPGNVVYLSIVDGQMYGVNSTLTLNNINIYEKPKDDDELKIYRSEEVMIEGLDFILPVNITQPLAVFSSNGSTKSMKFYSTDESKVVFNESVIQTLDKTGNTRVFVRNKYGLGKYVDIEIIEGVNISFICERKFLRLNETLPFKLNITPHYYAKDQVIQISNEKALIEDGLIIGKDLGDVDLIIGISNETINETEVIHFTIVDDGTHYNNVERMKKQNMSVGETYTTLGYYEDYDGGAATYRIMTYDAFLDSLPDDIKTVNFGTGNKKTPVDEYGNHTLDNGLVAKILTSDDKIVKVEQWGCKGDGRFDNTEALIHLFAQTKTGTIQFKNNGNYLLYGRNKNIAYYQFEKYLCESEYSMFKNCIKHQYIDLMCPHIPSGSYRGKPLMANINDIVLDGNGCTITIPYNQFALGTSEFGIFEFSGNVDGLEIKNFEFQQNGLNQYQYISDDGKTMEQPTRSHTIFFGDTNQHKWNRVNIHHNKFYECGTNINISDSGGDFILIANPFESKQVYIEDNEFYDWGRWVYSIDLGGSGERFYDYRFNRNKCIQTDNNYYRNLSNGNKGKYRGLGWIDFEARKCFTNLECCDNYVYGLTGWAINGGGKLTNNIIMKNNVLERNTLRSYKSAYTYEVSWYGAHIKNAVFENNRGQDDNVAIGCRLGYSATNVKFINNKYSKLELFRAYGDITITNCYIENETLFNSLGEKPDYEDNNLLNYCHIEIKNSTIYPTIVMFDKDNLNKYSNYTLDLDNNIIGSKNGTYINVIGKNLEFDVSQINIDYPPILYGFKQKVGTVGLSLPNNYIYTPNIIRDVDDVVTGCLSMVVKKDMYPDSVKNDLFEGYKALKCCNYGTLLSPNYSEFQTNTNYSKYKFLYYENRLYLCLNNGISGNKFPIHTNGIEENGTVSLYYYSPIAKYEKLQEIIEISIYDYLFKKQRCSTMANKNIMYDLGESIVFTLEKYPVNSNAIDDSITTITNHDSYYLQKSGNNYMIIPKKEGQIILERTSNNYSISSGVFNFYVQSHKGEFEEINNGLFFNINRQSKIENGIIKNNLNNDMNLSLIVSNVIKNNDGSFVLSGDNSYLKFSHHFFRDMMLNGGKIYFEICCEVNESCDLMNILCDGQSTYLNYYLQVKPKYRQLRMCGKNSWTATGSILENKQVFAMNWWGDSWANIIGQGIELKNFSVDFYLPDEEADLYIGLNAKMVIHEIKIFNCNIVNSDLKQEFFALYNKY